MSACRIGAAAVLLVSACTASTEDGAGPGTEAAPPRSEVSPESAPVTPSEANGTESPDETVAPTMQAPSSALTPPTEAPIKPTTVALPPDDPPLDPAIPADGLREQLGRAVGGDLVDPCGLIVNGRPDVTDPPPAFLGLQDSYGDPNLDYWAGTSPAWCVYDFEVGAPIEVTITGPDGSRAVAAVVLDPSSKRCSYHCPLASTLAVGLRVEPGEPMLAEALVADRVDGVLGGWIPSQAGIGRYLVDARQVSPTTGREILSHSGFTVVTPDIAGVAITPRDEPEGVQVGFVVGHDPDAPAGLGLYRMVPLDCDPVCETAGRTSAWQFVEMIDEVVTDENGAATLDIDPRRWDPGKYCVITPQSIPSEEEDAEGRDPCFWLAAFPAGFDRNWTAADSQPGRQVVVGGRAGGVDLSADGSRVATVDFDDVAVRDVAGRVLASIRREGANSLLFTAAGDQVVVGGNDGVDVWDLDTGERRTAVTGQVYDMALGSGGRYVVGQQDGAIRWWDIDTGEMGKVLDFPDFGSKFDLTDDFTAIVLGTNEGVWSWDFESDQLTPMMSERVEALEISPVGDEAAIVLDGVVSIRGLDGVVRNVLPTEGVAGATFSSDGVFIATHGPDGVVVWDRGGREVARLPHVVGEQTSEVQFGPDASKVLTVSEHGVVLWDL